VRPALLARERTNPKRIKDHGCHLGPEKSGRARVVRDFSWDAHCAALDLRLRALIVRSA